MQQMSDVKQKLRLLGSELDPLEKLSLIHIKGILDFRNCTDEDIINTYQEVYNQTLSEEELNSAREDISFI